VTNQHKKAVWFLTGSQSLYGQETLRQVERDSAEIVDGLNKTGVLPLPVANKAVLIDADGIVSTMRQANADDECIGVITWMHTFSPAKMWIKGLRELQVPLLHLHTQFNDRIPYATIDMDFMNLNQSAHGGREFGHVMSRLGLEREVVVGHWKDVRCQNEIADWMRAAVGRDELSTLRVARFGDNMRNVAVTEGDKVSAEETFGFTVRGYGVGDLVAHIDNVNEHEIDNLTGMYLDSYEVAPELAKRGSKHDALRYAARQELGLRSFLETGGYTAFTDTFEDLHGIDQLPGLAVQRLMADGYGFGAEGDWKTAALLRAMKVMAIGLPGGTSFMEDYTYDFTGENSKVLGAHMLEVCPSISAAKRASLEIHPLGIGGKSDPVRLVFDTTTGSAINVTVVDLGNRYRMVVNDVEVVKPEQKLPKLPVARALWRPQPNLAVAAAAWIYAGGAHHTVFSMALNATHLRILADMFGIEYLHIGERTAMEDFRKELRWNEVSYSR